jgi:hypothetical protein
MPSPSDIAKKEDLDSGIGGGVGMGAQGQGGESGVVKANKGMILRKYIRWVSVSVLVSVFWGVIVDGFLVERYLQQLVAAQATRNRELELQLNSFRGRGGVSGNGNGNVMGSLAPPDKSIVGEDEMGMMLHEEVGDSFVGAGLS